jgi:hypothetical protein
MVDIFVASRDEGRGSKRKRGSVSAKASGSKSAKRRPEDYSDLVRAAKQVKGSLGAFLVRPKRLRFETQEKREKSLLLLRRHVITNVPWLLLSLMWMVLPWLFWVMSVKTGGEPILSFVPVKFRVVGLSGWYLLVGGFILENFLSWYFNVYIVTDERIVDIDFYSLIYKEVSGAKIENIQDVTFTMGGVIRALFNFGTIYIQTAGEKREFDFEDVPRPQQVAKFLNEMYLEEEREKIEGRVR